MTRKLALGFALLLISGCATIKATPPPENEIDRSRTYSLDYEKTWTRAVDWFADHNVIIEKIEKTSGLLTAKHKLRADSTYLDCGKIDAQGTFGKPTIQRFGTLNVTIRSSDESTTIVNVNFFGEFQLQAIDTWDLRSVSADGRCVSTGQLEQNILDYIGHQG